MGYIKIIQQGSGLVKTITVNALTCIPEGGYSLTISGLESDAVYALANTSRFCVNAQQAVTLNASFRTNSNGEIVIPFTSTEPLQFNKINGGNITYGNASVGDTIYLVKQLGADVDCTWFDSVGSVVYALSNLNIIIN